jgi:hypothetical protein
MAFEIGRKQRLRSNRFHLMLGVAKMHNSKPRTSAPKIADKSSLVFDLATTSTARISHWSLVTGQKSAPHCTLGVPHSSSCLFIPEAYRIFRIRMLALAQQFLVTGTL